MEIDSTHLDQKLYSIIRPLLGVTGEGVTRNTEDIQKQIVVNNGSTDRKTLFMATDGRSMATVMIREPYSLFYAAHAFDVDTDAATRPLAIPLESLPRIKAGEHTDFFHFGQEKVGRQMREMALGEDSEILPPGPTRYLTKDIKKEFSQLKTVWWENVEVVLLPWVKGDHHFMTKRIKQGLDMMKGTLTHIYLTRRHRLCMRSWYKGRQYQYIVMPIVPKK